MILGIMWSIQFNELPVSQQIDWIGSNGILQEFGEVVLCCILMEATYQKTHSTEAKQKTAFRLIAFCMCNAKNRSNETKSAKRAI